jgi:hypothetical protein
VGLSYSSREPGFSYVFGGSVLFFTSTWVLLCFWWVCLILHEYLGSPRFLVGLSYSSRELGFSYGFGGSVLLLTRTWVLLGFGCSVLLFTRIWVLLGFCGSVLLFTSTWVLLGFWWVFLTLHEYLGSPRFLVGLSYSSRVPGFS